MNQSLDLSLIFLKCTRIRLSDAIPRAKAPTTIPQFWNTAAISLIVACLIKKLSKTITPTTDVTSLCSSFLIIIYAITLNVLEQYRVKLVPKVFRTNPTNKTSTTLNLTISCAYICYLDSIPLTRAATAKFRPQSWRNQTRQKRDLAHLQQTPEWHRFYFLPRRISDSPIQEPIIKLVAICSRSMIYSTCSVSHWQWISIGTISEYRSALPSEL